MYLCVYVYIMYTLSYKKTIIKYIVINILRSHVLVH